MKVIERKALNNHKIHKLPWWKKHEHDTKRKEWKNNSSFFLPRLFLFSNMPLLTLTIHMGFTRKQHNKHLAESNDFTVVMGTCSNQKLGGLRFHMSQNYTHLTLSLVQRAFIRFPPFYRQSCLSSSWHRFKKMLKTFQNLVSKLCAVHPWCVSPVPAHPKGPPLDWGVTWSPFEYTDLTVMSLLYKKSLLPSRSTVSLSTQTENFFTTELSSYLSFC